MTGCHRYIEPTSGRALPQKVPSGMAEIRLAMLGSFGTRPGSRLCISFPTTISRHGLQNSGGACHGYDTSLYGGISARKQALFMAASFA